MLFLRHNLKNIIRSAGKSLVSVLLIALLTAVLSLEAGVFLSVQSFLKEADRNYTTVANIEFLGEFYPDSEALDPAAVSHRDELANSPAAADPAVKSWNLSRIALGRISSAADGKETGRQRL